jgi:hypothetical protein
LLGAKVAAADTDNVMLLSDVFARPSTIFITTTQDDIPAALLGILFRWFSADVWAGRLTDDRVSAAMVVAAERGITDGSVLVAVNVPKERLITDGSVLVADSVIKERLIAGGGVATILSRSFSTA